MLDIEYMIFRRKHSQPTKTIIETEKIAEKSFNKFDLQRIISFFYILLAFLLPIFFVPFTADVFDLNKTFLTMIISFIVLILYFIYLIQKKRFEVIAFKAYLPFLAILIAGGLSVGLSINKHISIYGFFKNYSSSYVFMVGLIFLAFVATNVELNYRSILKWFSLGVLVSSFVSVLAYLGVPLPSIGRNFRQFTLAGATSYLFGIQLFSTLTALYLLSEELKTKKIKWVTILSFVIVFNVFYLVISANVASILVLLVGIIYLVFTGKLEAHKYAGTYFGIFMGIVVLSFLVYFPTTRNVLGIEDFTQPLRLGIKESWYVSATTVRDKPLAGSGFGTNFMNVSRYRPASLNMTDAWQVRFHQPYNDLFLWLATTGLVGFSLYLIFWGILANFAYRLRKTDGLYTFSFVSVLAILLVLGFNPILMVFLFILAGVMIYRLEFPVTKVKGIWLPAILLFVVLAVFGVFSYKAYQVYAGEYYYNESLKTNSAIERYNLEKKALSNDLYESTYRRDAVTTGLFIVNKIAQNKDATDNDTKVAQQLIKESIADARRLTELVNPLDVANWELRGNAYNFVAGIDKNLVQFAIQAYTNAINLEPTNPVLWVNLGSIYYKQGLYQNAVQAFNRASQLKNDYANAHYNLAYALKDAGDINRAITELEIVLRLLPEDSPDKDRVKSELETFKNIAEQQKKASEEKAKALQVEQQNPKDVKPTDKQEPLKKPAENVKQLETDGVEVPDEVKNPDDNTQLESDTGIGQGGTDTGTNSGTDKNNEQTQSDEAGTADTEETPKADGSTVDQNQGETDSPIAKPAE